MRHRPPSRQAPAAAAALSPRVCAARLALCREADGQKIGARGLPNARWRRRRIACGKAQEPRAAAAAMRAASPEPHARERAACGAEARAIRSAKGWAIHAEEGPPARAAERVEGAGVCKYADIDGVCGLAAVIEDHGRPGARIDAPAGEDLAEARAAFREYAGVGGGCALAECIGLHGSRGAKVHEHIGNNLDQTRAAFEEYAGAFNCAASFDEDPIRDAGRDISNARKRCIDRRPLARNRKSNGEMLVFETGGGAFRIVRPR